MIKTIVLHIYNTVEISTIKMYVFIYHMIMHNHTTYSFGAQFKWIMGFT